MRSRVFVVVALAGLFSCVWIGAAAAAVDPYGTPPQVYGTPPGQTPSGPAQDIGTQVAGAVTSRGVGEGNLAKTGSDILGMLALGALLLLVGDAVLLVAFRPDLAN